MLLDVTDSRLLVCDSTRVKIFIFDTNLTLPMKQKVFPTLEKIQIVLHFVSFVNYFLDLTVLGKFSNRFCSQRVTFMKWKIK